MRLNVERPKDHKEQGYITKFKWVHTGDLLFEALKKQRLDHRNFNESFKKR